MRTTEYDISLVIMQVLRKAEEDVTDQDLQTIFDALDSDGDGVLTIDGPYVMVLPFLILCDWELFRGAPFLSDIFFNVI